MLKKAEWKEDNILSAQLRPDLYTLAQVRHGACLQFFDVQSENGEWHDIDLSKVPELFCIIVAWNRLKKVFAGSVPEQFVKPNRRAMPMQMIDYRGAAGGGFEADLIELTDDYSNVGADVLKAGLKLPKDLELVYAHELVGMVGDPEKLKRRLIRFFDTRVNWDEAKAVIFKGIQPPGPRLKVVRAQQGKK